MMPKGKNLHFTFLLSFKCWHLFSCLILLQMLIHELQSSRWWNEHSKENVYIINIYELLWDWIETRETSNLSFFCIIYLPNRNYIKHTMTSPSQFCIDVIKVTKTGKAYQLSSIWIIEIRLFHNPTCCTLCLKMKCAYNVCVCFVC